MSALPVPDAAPDQSSAYVDLTGEAPVIHLGGETFPCVTKIAPGPLFELMSSAAPNSAGYTDMNLEEASQMRAVWQFLFACIAEGEEYRFQRLLHRKRDPVDPEAFGECIQPLIEYYTARPSEPRSSSPDGPSGTSASSTVDSPSPDSPSESGALVKTVNFGRGTVTVDEATSDSTSGDTST